MNLSNQSRQHIGQIGTAISILYMMKLSPLQIMILVEVRHAEAQLERGKHLLAHVVRASVAQLHADRGFDAPSRQLFWVALNDLIKRQLIYMAPPKKSSRHRALALTLQAADIFKYPASIHPYKITQPTTTP
jgi:hypothetical protein